MTTRLMSLLILTLLLLVSIGLIVFSGDIDLLSVVREFREQAGQQQSLSLLWFSLAVFVSQLLVIPSGSALMLFGGFVFGAPVATFIFSAIQLCITVLLVWLGRKSGAGRLATALSGWSTLLESTFATLDRVPLTLGIVLRLFPVLPSAIACLLSVVFAIPLRLFLLATALVGWIRPLLFASAGALLPSLLDLEASQSDIAMSVLWPASLLFFSGLMLLLLRIWLTRKSDNSV